MRVPPVVDKAVRFWRAFNADGGGLLAAAVAYNSLFALAPALLLVVVVGEVLLGRQEVAARLFATVADSLGTAVATQLQQVLEAYLASRSQRAGAGVVGVLLLVWALGGMFAKLQQAFGMLWHVRLRRDLPRWVSVRVQASRFLFALLPVALAVAGGIVVALSGMAARLVGLEPGAAARIAGSPVTTAVLAALALAVLYRLLPYADLRVADVIAPAATVAAVWTLGTFAFGWYLARGTQSAAGAAGSVFALLVWLNYSSLVLLMGCSACRVIAEKRGRGGPSSYAEPAVPSVNRDGG